MPKIVLKSWKLSPSNRIAAARALHIGPTMKKNYDFSKAVKNPYAKRLKLQLTLHPDEDRSVRLLEAECDRIKTQDGDAHSSLTLKDEKVK